MGRVMSARAAVGLSVAAAMPIASQATGATTPIPKLLSRLEEMTMALAAAPAHLRAGAAVYVLERNGFVLARPGTNGFSCIVNRDHPLNRKPTCFDAEGSATIVPTILYQGELLMKGTPLIEIAADVKAGFESGRFVSPRRAGVAYMLSGDVRVYNAATGTVGSFPPHMMFYAPNVTNKDLGVTLDAMVAEPWLPSIAYQGPQGYIIVMVDPKALGHHR